MRILLDANLSPRVAAALRASGYEALHVGDVDMLTAADATASKLGDHVDLAAPVAVAQVRQAVARTGAAACAHS